jgi:hypothetical protein
MLYVQSFTLIKSTGTRISSTGTGRIPSPTVQNIHSLIGTISTVIGMSMVYFRKLHSKVHDLHMQHYGFWISPIAMNLDVF